MSVLEELHKTSIRVSDISAQYWCERQMELNYIHGPKITKEIQKGSKIHEELEGETNVPIMLQPRSYADSLYKALYTSHQAVATLKAKGVTREVQLYGSLGGYKVVGKIDQLQNENGETAILEDKTRGNDTMPSDAQVLTHRVQVMIYKKMLDDVTSGDYNVKNFVAGYRTAALKMTDEFVRQLNAAEIERNLQDIGTIAQVFFDDMRTLNKISNTLYIRYLNQFTKTEIKLEKLSYDGKEAQGIITHVLKYWNGERKSLPVPESEKWKCRWCAFFNKECTVWSDQKAL
ncbi:MAG TPA: PD-(D/E)XK nuclease family protein [Candidatus Acidoferrales bacterium]|nr:PD-(D/E)XK nuclease family protein [Candidatus Acidoferrales bacterium]